MKQFYADDIKLIRSYTIPVNTILYSGGLKSESLPSDPTIYKFFTKDINVAKTYSKLYKGTVSTFKVVTPIQLFIQPKLGDIFYFDTAKGYSSPQAQCLIQDGYHGYATEIDKFEIEDIGLANVYTSLQIITTAGKRTRRKTLRRKKIRR